LATVLRAHKLMHMFRHLLSALVYPLLYVTDLVPDTITQRCSKVGLCVDDAGSNLCLIHYIIFIHFEDVKYIFINHDATQLRFRCVDIR
jgi:hypothetical protein